MKWLEVIEFRTVYKDWNELRSQLENLITDIRKGYKFQNIRIYRHLLVDTDFIINLYHDTERINNEGSSLGLRIASSLKEFGLVNHKVLIELSNEDEQRNISSQAK